MVPNKFSNISHTTIVIIGGVGVSNVSQKLTNQEKRVRKKGIHFHRVTP